MKNRQPTFYLKVDVTNPGQFFACCGVLELADRLWPGTQGCFDESERRFCLHTHTKPEGNPSRSLLESLAGSSLINTMTADQIRRRNALQAMPQKERKQKALEAEKKTLDKLWREAPLVLGEPFGLRIDWFLDDYAGGSTFKTWAGQQSVIDIATAMKTPIESENLLALSSEEWFFGQSDNRAVPFNFDAALGNQGSDREIGFSLDPLNLSMVVRPMIEFLAFVGLQRFRPTASSQPNRYRYSTWSQPLCPELGSLACFGGLPLPALRSYEFSLLFRTKYLKSFLPAIPIGDYS